MDILQSLDPRFTAAALQILRLSVWLVLLAAVFTPIERLFGLHPRSIFRRGILTDLAFYFLSSLVPSLVLSLPLSILAWGVHHTIPTAFATVVAGSPLWFRVTASLLVGEIGFYWGHRWRHELPVLWRFRAIHHSPEHLNFLVNTRAHPVDMIFTRLCGLVPLYVLGLASPMHGAQSLIPVLLVLAGTVWGFFLHANVRWRFGPLEWLISTPAFHHWHHTNDGPAYSNKNYSPMLPWARTPELKVTVLPSGAGCVGGAREEDEVVAGGGPAGDLLCGAEGAELCRGGGGGLFEAAINDVDG